MGSQTWLQSQRANDEALAWGHRIYMKSGYLGSLPDELVDALVDHAAHAPGEDVSSIWAFGGALGCLPDDATAFTGRAAPFWIGAETQWDDPTLDHAHVGWSRDGITLSEPVRVTGAYVNDVSESGDDALVRAAYGDAKYGWLAALKRAWDPDNVFRLNQDIRPDLRAPALAPRTRAGSAFLRRSEWQWLGHPVRSPALTPDQAARR